MLTRALAGVRVIEWCQGIAGPYCSRLLAEFGATVIKIEAPGTGDAARWRGPFLRGATGPVGDPESSALFFTYNVSKMSVTLRPELPAGADVLRELVSRADVFLEDREPGVLAELGCGEQALRGGHPELVILSLSPFGQTGPYRGYKAHGACAFHAGGEGYLQPGGPARTDKGDRPPAGPGGDVAETMTGMTAACGAIAALLRRGRTGRGDHLDVSKQEALMTLSRTDLSVYPNQGVIERRDTRLLPIGGLFQTLDGFIEINPTERRMWEGLVEAMGRPAWSQAPSMQEQTPPFSHAAEVRQHVEEWTRHRHGDEIERLLQEHKCVSGAILSLGQVANKEQFHHRQLFAAIHEPRFGTVRLATSPFGGDKPTYRPAPHLGEHTDQVLAELGLNPGDIESLREKGVV